MANVLLQLMFVSSSVAVIAISLPPPPSLSMAATSCLHGCDQFRSPGRRRAWDSIGTSVLLAIAAAPPLLCLFVRLQSGRREPAMQVNPSAMHGRKRDAGMIRVS